VLFKTVESSRPTECGETPQGCLSWSCETESRHLTKMETLMSRHVTFMTIDDADYSEGLTRTNATGGITIVTFPPLLGMSDVMLMFLTADQVNDMVEKPA
jgi:phage terminase large subunit-like protein